MNSKSIRVATGLVVLATAALVPTSAVAQQIPRDEYLRFLPKSYMRAVEATPASVAMKLWGDETDAAYRDVDPVDGIDDERGRTLHALGVRFAPYMVQNTTNLPMDFKRFWDLDPNFPLIIDTWNIALADPMRTSADTISLPDLHENPCDDPVNAVGPQDDCRLLRLLREYYPPAPQNRFMTTGISGDRFEEFRVLFFDMPGENEQEWQDEYRNAYSGLLPSRYQNFARAYSHPFIKTVESGKDGVLGYELVIQYWFYYPLNDGGNNHEGDWEHINVVVAPRSMVTRPQTEAEIQAMLAIPGDQVDSQADPLVIKRVEAFFHHFFQTVDYAHPNAYAPEDEWQREVDGMVQEQRNEKWFWWVARQLAYWDDAETVLNTNPVVYIGADNKGLDQLLHPPGGRNRDSHGTYLFPGMYKDIGPLGATEQISAKWFDHREWYAEGGERNTVFGRDAVVAYDEPDLLEVIPDWERVVDLVQEDVGARREWFWMVLPIRWGYPAVESPGAGIVGNADTGNLGPKGPTYNDAWNRAGAGPSYHEYHPHKLVSLFPLGWQDNFINEWGYLNLTGPTLVTLPPFDFIWRMGSAPIRYATGHPDPVYYPSEDIPTRFVGVGAVYSTQPMSDRWNALFLNDRQLVEIVEALLELDPSGELEFDGVDRQETATGPALLFGFFLGKGLATENLVRHTRSTLGSDLTPVADPSQTAALRGELNFWEYAGSLRYNLKRGGFLPYLKAGWGISWYRLENVSIDGELLETPDGPWIRKPNKLKNLLPNTWNFGAGFEFNFIRSQAKPIKGLDVAVRADWTMYTHNLGIREGAGEFAPEIAVILLEGERIWRHQFNFALVLGF